MTDEAKRRNITVARPFTFLYKSGAMKRFEPGLHEDVGDEVADYPHLHLHVLQDGEQIPKPPVDLSDPGAAAKRVAALEEMVTRLTAEVEQHKAHADRAEADLNDARTKAEAADVLTAEVDDLKIRNAALEADVERLTKPPTPAAPVPAVKPAGKPI